MTDDLIKCEQCGFFRDPRNGCRFSVRHPRCGVHSRVVQPKFIGGEKRMGGPPKSGHGNRGKTHEYANTGSPARCAAQQRRRERERVHFAARRGE